MIRRACFILFVVSFVVLPIRTLPQQPTASLQGIIVEAGRDTPIAKATVELRTLSGNGPAIASTRTDSGGKFYLMAVPGSYRLVVSHAGHVTAEYGQRAPGGPATTIALTAGQHAADVRIAMTAAGVISGRVIDKGQPIGLADAIALKAVYTEGQLSLTPVLSIRTDDLGEYHLFWLPPGRYYIVGVVWDTASSIPRYVNPDGSNINDFYTQRYIGRAVFFRATGGGVAENEAHLPMYYPGTPDPQLAIAIDVQPGAVLRGIDIDASAVPTRHVSGRVVGMPPASATQAGQQVRANVNMRPLTASLNVSSAQAPSAVTDSSGNFDISNAVPGRYVLTAAAGNLTGRTLVEVRERDVIDLVVPLVSGFNVTGRIVLDRTSPAPTDLPLAGMRVVLRTDTLLPGATTYGAAVQPDGSFTIPAPSPGAQAPAGPVAGDYRVLVTPILTAPTPLDQMPPSVPVALQNLYVKSIRMGDADILNDRLHLNNQPQEPLTIVIGMNPGIISGRVLDERQQPATNMTIVLVHDDGLRYRVNEKTTSSDFSGRFEFQSVPPGNYKLFAWEGVERGAWQDPGFMRTYEDRGQEIRIKEGTKQEVQLAVIPAGRR